MTTVNDYLSNMQSAIGRHFAPGGMFSGREGALKLARDLGQGLACFPDDEVGKVMGSLYSTMLVRFTFGSGNVPINNKEFVTAIKTSIAESKQHDAERRMLRQAEQNIHDAT